MESVESMENMESRFENFISLIIEISRSIQRIKDAKMSELGLKASHTMVLYYLSQHGDGLTATNLTELCIIDKAAISRTLKQLICMELIYTNHVENKRSYRNRYYLTDEGKELASNINSIIEDALATAGVGIDDETRTIMYKGLRSIRDNLNDFQDEQEIH